MPESGTRSGAGAGHQSGPPSAAGRDPCRGKSAVDTAGRRAGAGEDGHGYGEDALDHRGSGRSRQCLPCVLSG
ncbi:MAG: hypothetical protein ACTSRS_02620, partial [Candidatus Helarchaeota archaeon]